MPELNGSDHIKIKNQPNGQYWCYFGQHYVEDSVPAGQRNHTCRTHYNKWIAAYRRDRRALRTPEQLEREQEYQREYSVKRRRWEQMGRDLDERN